MLQRPERAWTPTYEYLLQRMYQQHGNSVVTSLLQNQNQLEQAPAVIVAAMSTAQASSRPPSHLVLQHEAMLLAWHWVRWQWRRSNPRRW